MIRVIYYSIDIYLFVSYLLFVREEPEDFRKSNETRKKEKPRLTITWQFITIIIVLFVLLYFKEIFTALQLKSFYGGSLLSYFIISEYEFRYECRSFLNLPYVKVGDILKCDYELRAPANLTETELDLLNLELKTPHESYKLKIIENSHRFNLFLIGDRNITMFVGSVNFNLPEAGDNIIFLNTDEIKHPFLIFRVYSDEEINLHHINNIMLFILVLTTIFSIPAGVKAFKEMGEA